ncbi:unnamed protein product [Cuscuta epithymum]|uniref:Uncharacterized protein n=1 Tax=Cuscuta epithymum TaxID=186058 RepID=A0AAV0CEB3_9ASTE|nr:unnamed protein product [Cuscuta epithymum]
MSKMPPALKSSKPPLPTMRSPIRLRSRPPLKPTTNTFLQTPPRSITRSELPKRRLNGEECGALRPEYHTISAELRALARMVNQEIGNEDEADKENHTLNPGRPLFERGKFYEEYSARRNERLKKRKGGETGEEEEEKTRPMSSSYGLGVRVELAKKRVVQSSGRKSVPATPMVEERRQTLTPAPTSRYMLRSRKGRDEKKPAPALMSERRSKRC